MDFKIILHRCSPWRVEVPFETFVHARTLTLSLPLFLPPPPPPQKKKKKKNFSDKDSSSIYRKRATHTFPDTPPNFFSDLDYLPAWISVSEYFYKLTKNPFFYWGWGGGWGGVVAGGGGVHNVQMFKMALLLFKEYKCAKLFWNACLNTEEMAQTSSIFNHFITWSSSVSLALSVLNGTTTPQGEHLCKIIFESTHKCRSYGPGTSSVYDHFIIWPSSVTLTFNPPKQIF